MDSNEDQVDDSENVGHGTEYGNIGYDECFGKHNPPPQFDTSDIGSPTKIWSIICETDEKYSRGPVVFACHPKINPHMRSLLIEWIMEVCADRRLHRETFHLCVDYLDRYLACTKNLDHSKLQLVASTALSIASKIEEVYPPKISEIAEFTDGACLENDICNLEEVMLQKLEWKFTPVTSVHWLALYLQLMNTNDIVPEQTRTIASIKHVSLTPPRTSLTMATLINQSCDSGILSSSSITPSDHHDLEEVHFAKFDDLFAYNGISISHQTSNIGHYSPDRRFTVPKLMRDEFVSLSSILDVSLLDARSLRFKYRELSAALILCCYEPENLVAEITGLDPRKLYEARLFMEPFVQIFEKMNPTGTFIPYFSEVPAHDRHNIQTYNDRILEYLEYASALRESLKASRKEKEHKIPGRIRKRKFGTVTQNA